MPKLREIAADLKKFTMTDIAYLAIAAMLLVFTVSAGQGWADLFMPKLLGFTSGDAFLTAVRAGEFVPTALTLTVYLSLAMVPFVFAGVTFLAMIKLIAYRVVWREMGQELSA